MLPHLEDVEMKNRLYVALLLAVVLALPALAQQASSTTQDQPAAAAQSTDQSAASATGASGKPALQPDTHEGFWGKINPFARKKYVQRQTQPIRDRVKSASAAVNNSESLSDAARQRRMPSFSANSLKPMSMSYSTSTWSHRNPIGCTNTPR